MTVTEKISRRLNKMGAGAVFTRADFLDLGTTDHVGMVFGRLLNAGKIRRVGRGLYESPRTHAVLGLLSPPPEAIAKAAARRFGSRLQPSGAQAANLFATYRASARAHRLPDRRAIQNHPGRQAHDRVSTSLPAPDGRNRPHEWNRVRSVARNRQGKRHTGTGIPSAQIAFHRATAVIWSRTWRLRQPGCTRTCVGSQTRSGP